MRFHLTAPSDGFLFRGALWRIDHEACTSDMLTILDALSRPEIEAGLFDSGRLTGRSLYDRVMTAPTFARHLSDQTRETVGELMGQAYAGRIPEIQALVLNLGLVRHCSIFETNLTRGIETILRIAPKLSLGFRSAIDRECNERKRAELKDASDADELVLEFYFRSPFKTKLKVLEHAFSLELEEVFARRDVHLSLDPKLNRAHLLGLFKQRNRFVHSLSPYVNDRGHLQEIGQCFEQFSSSVFRALASSANLSVEK